MSDDEKSIYKVVKLKGSENYPEWELSISTTLIAKDLFDAILVSEGPKSAGDNRKCQKAFALIIQSLSPIIQSSLSFQAQNISDLNVPLLWEELKTSYSASTGARKAALLREMWTTPIQEDKEPMQHLAAIRSAHSQINSAGKSANSTLSDEMLAYAMTMALPNSYSTLQQTLWLRNPLTSAEVQGAVQAEYARRKTETSTALIAAKKSKFQTAGKFEFKPKDMSKYCDFHKNHGHSTEDCVTRKRIERRATSTASKAEASANKAEVTDGFGSDGSAFLAFATLANVGNLANSSFVIDTGASHHMCNDLSLFSSISSIPGKRIIMGNGSALECNASGAISFGNFTLNNVLYVPKLDRNLLSPGFLPETYSWTGTNKEMTLYDGSKPILSASKQNGLYTCKTGINDLAI